MVFGFVDLVLILLVVAGPTKALALFAAATGHLPVADRVAIAVKAVVTSAVILFVFALLGGQIIDFFHVSVPALELAGGAILFVFALRIVLGSGHDDHGETGDPKAMALYPLAMPLIASPQAIVVLVIVMSRIPAFEGERVPVLAALALVVAINAVVLIGTAYLMQPGGGEKKAGGIAEVILRVVAVMLCALAIQLMLLGVRDLGLIADATIH